MSDTTVAPQEAPAAAAQTAPPPAETTQPAAEAAVAAQPTPETQPATAAAQPTPAEPASEAQPATAAAQPAPATPAAEAQPTTAAAAPAAPAPGQPATDAGQVAQVVTQEFASYDKDASGGLDKTEFGQWMIALRKAAQPAFQAESAEATTWVGQAFAQADVDKNATINQSELTNFLTPKPA
ncbi:MAG: hypothetical protein V4574_21760 [Pseudomonadota bacterium]